MSSDIAKAFFGVAKMNSGAAERLSGSAKRFCSVAKMNSDGAKALSGVAGVNSGTAKACFRLGTA